MECNCCHEDATETIKVTFEDSGPQDWCKDCYNGYLEFINTDVEGN